MRDSVCGGCIAALTEGERVSLGLLSAWDLQLKHMLEAASTDPTSPRKHGGSPNAASGQRSPLGGSPRKSEHGPTMGDPAEPQQPAGGGFGDLWATFLRTDV